MSRLTFPTTIDDAPETSQTALKAISPQLGLLKAISPQLGFTPNLFQLVSLSPAALGGVVGPQGALAKTFDARTRDVIALAVSDVNGSSYCLSAHSHVAARFNHATQEDISLARQGRSTDLQREAAGTFARRVVEHRGKVAQRDIKAVRDAGYSDKQIVEIVALSAQFLLTKTL